MSVNQSSEIKQYLNFSNNMFQIQMTVVEKFDLSYVYLYMTYTKTYTRPCVNFSNFMYSCDHNCFKIFLHFYKSTLKEKNVLYQEVKVVNFFIYNI